MGSAQPNISAKGIMNFQITFPPKQEIMAITSYISSECGNINPIIEACKSQISLLQERKQIIINEVVTGKVKVSNN